MAVSQYEKDRIARVEARKKNRTSTKPKSTYKSPKTSRQKAQDEIKQYKLDFYGKPSSSTTSKAKPTATSGGSKAVRKIDPKKKSLVDRLRDKPFKYLKE